MIYSKLKVDELLQNIRTLNIEIDENNDDNFN